MTDWRRFQTERLLLEAPTSTDLDEFHALCADPRVWSHQPLGRHVFVDQTRTVLERWMQEWAAAGLGQWLLRAGPNEPLVGNAGCAIRGDGAWWNLGYRLSPSVQGQGLAEEAAAAALRAANVVAPERPVVASLLDHNTSSRRLAERLGLTLAYRGLDTHYPDLGGIRLLYSDRPLGPPTIDRILGT